MAQSNVTVTINGSDYPMACAPGEEDKVKALGERIDSVASQIAAASGSIGESRLLVMAALILTDQLSELEQKDIFIRVSGSTSKQCCGHKPR